MNFSRPLATLVATSADLTITTTMFGLFDMGTYTFPKTHVKSIERYCLIPFLAEGIRITHLVADYPAKIIFWCRPQTVLDGIASAGFVPAPTDAVISAFRPHRGMAFRIAPLVGLAIIWNALLYDHFSAPSAKGPMPGPRVLIAMTMVAGLSLAALYVPAVQVFLLKPGRSFAEVRPIVMLTAFITGCMTVTLGLITLIGRTS
jgi:hypothetical protein